MRCQFQCNHWGQSNHICIGKVTAWIHQRSHRFRNYLRPHPNFSDEVNWNIIESEIEGGVYLDLLSEGAVLELETQNHWHTMVSRGGGPGTDLGSSALLS